MKRKRKISSKEGKKVRICLDKAKSAAGLRRVLCVWLRIKGYNVEQISDMVGWSKGHVQKVQSEFIRHGESALMRPGKGGRRNRHMTIDREKAFISSLQDIKTGIIFLKLIEIKGKFESDAKLPEGTMASSTIYRLLGRHGYKSVQLNDGRRAFAK